MYALCDVGVLYQYSVLFGITEAEMCFVCVVYVFVPVDSLIRAEEFPLCYYHVICVCVCAIYAVLCDCVERMHMLFSCVCYYWALLFVSFDEMIYTFMYARARIKSSH